jgi:hypothetical protein
LFTFWWYFTNKKKHCWEVLDVVRSF